MKVLLALLLFSASVVNAESANADDAQPERDIASRRFVSSSGKTPVRKNKYFGFGPAVMSNANVTGVGLYVALAYGFEVDTTLIRIRGDIGGRGGAILADVGLGVTYFLINTDKAPFIGLDFGYGIARVRTGGDEFLNGFVVGAIAGVTFLRTAAINLEIAIRAAVLLESSPLGKPAMAGLRMGLYF